MDKASKTDIEQRLKQYLVGVDPLADESFRILLSDKKIFRRLINNILEKEISGDALIAINTSIIYRQDGKEVRLDTAFRNESGAYNVEAQKKAKKFSFKRHLYYWSALFAYTLGKGGTSGDYEKLKPVVSIVVYSNTGREQVMRKANLSGDLFAVSEDKDLLQMYSLNAKLWKEASKKWLKNFLALVYLGLDKDASYYAEQGLDTESHEFLTLYNAMYVSCCSGYVNILEKKGDSGMAENVRSFLSAKELAKFEAREDELEEKIKEYQTSIKEREASIKETIKASIIDKIKLCVDFGCSVKETADKLNMSLSEVKKLAAEEKIKFKTNKSI